MVLILKMRRYPNLELRLLPPSVSLNSDYPHPYPHPMSEMLLGESPSEIGQNNQLLTIFYNGRISVCDVTEFQARSVISLASQEREEKSKTPTGSIPSSPPVYSPTTGLSMKRSLQQFLQQRKNRIQATSPYSR